MLLSQQIFKTSIDRKVVSKHQLTIMVNCLTLQLVQVLSQLSVRRLTSVFKVKGHIQLGNTPLTYVGRQPVTFLHLEQYSLQPLKPTKGL